MNAADRQQEQPRPLIRRGPLLMVLAGFMLTGMVACVKIVRADLSAIDVVLWRGIVAVPVAAIIASRTGFKIHNREVMALRVTLGFGAMVCFFTAAKGLAVADLTLVMRLQPVVIAVIAPLALGASERATGRIWVLLLAGLVGCGILLGPSLGMGSLWGLWGLGAMALSSGAHTCLRALSHSDRAPTIVFWFQLMATVLAFVITVGSTGALPPLPAQHLWPCLAGVGVFATLGQLLMTRAYALDRATSVAAASHVTPLWAVIIDIVVFSVLPGWNVLVGGGIVLAAAVLLIFGSGLPLLGRDHRAR